MTSTKNLESKTIEINKNTRNFKEVFNNLKVGDKVNWDFGEEKYKGLINNLRDKGLYNNKHFENLGDFIADRKSLKLITISNADTVDIRYDFKSQVWWKEQDPSATIIRELTIKDETILTQARAEILARNTLERVNISQTKGNISSEAIVTNFKWYQTLELAVTNFTGTFNIVGYTETIAETYTVNFDLSVVLDQNSQKILDLIKQVDKLASQNFESVTIKDGFFLQDLMAITDYLEGFESGIGTRFYYDISDWDDSKTYDTGETSETQFL